MQLQPRTVSKINSLHAAADLECVYVCVPERERELTLWVPMHPALICLHCNIYDAVCFVGSLHVGDEILEVQGHSLIGVSREYAIGFLKQIQLNDSVTLLVSQEPETWVNPAKEKAALRHTAL